MLVRRRSGCERTIVYLSDPTPARGSGELRDQLRAAVRVAAGRPVHRLIVDAGAPSGRGPRLDDLIRAGAERHGGDVVIIEGPHRLGADRRSCDRAMADLLAAGFVLKDPSGELHPAGATPALAEASALREAGSGRRAAPKGSRPCAGIVRGAVA